VGLFRRVSNLTTMVGLSLEAYADFVIADHASRFRRKLFWINDVERQAFLV
jgi:hypothetical protein